MTKKPTYAELEDRIFLLEKEIEAKNNLLESFKINVKDNNQSKVNNLENEKIQLNAHHKSLFEQASIGIMYFDKDTNIISCNDFILNLTQIPKEKLIGTNLLKTITNKQQILALQKAMNGEIGFFEGEYKFVISGHNRFIRNTYSTSKDTFGNLAGGICIIYDIAAEKKTELELIEAKEQAVEMQQRFDYAASIGKVGFWDWNLLTNALIWSKEIYHLLGFEPYSIEPSYEVFLEMVHPEDREFLDSNVKAAFQKKKTYSVDCRILKKNSEILITNSTGKVEYDEHDNPIRMIGTFQDITERNNIEHELIKNEALTTVAVENLPIIFYMIDNKGIFQLSIGDGLKSLGLQANQVVGKSAFDLYREFPSILQAIRQALSGEIATFESNVNGASHLNIVSPFLISRQQEGIVGVALDITESKQIESQAILAKENAQEREETYKMLFDSISDAVFISEVDESGQSFHFIRVNQVACELLGYTNDELLSKTFAEINSEKALLNLTELVKNVLEINHSVIETEFITKTGKIIPVEMSTTITQFRYKTLFHSIVHNITERKKVENNLREINIRLKQAVDIAKLGSWNYSLKNDSFIFTDELFAILNTTAELEGGYIIPTQQYAEKFVHPDDRYMVGHEIQKALNSPELDFSSKILHRIIDTKGNLKHVTVHYRIIKDKQGKVIQNYGVNQDITEQIKIQETLVQNEAWLSILFEKAPIGITSFDAKTNITSCNEHICEIMNIKPEQIIGVNIMATVRDQKQKDALEEALNGRIGVYEDQYQFVTGKQTKYIRNTFAPILDESGIFIGGMSIVEDISERKLAELEIIKAKEKAEENEQQYRIIGETIPYGVWLADETGFCTYVSNSFLEMVDMDMDKLQKFGWMHLLPPQDIAPTSEQWLNCIKTGKNFEKEHLFKQTDGTYRNVLAIGRPIKDDNGKIIKWVGLNLDITERKKAEHDLLSAKEKAEESDRLKTAFLQNMSHEIRTPLNAISGFSGMLSKPQVSDEKKKSFISIIQNSSKQLISIVSDILTISSLETKQEKLNIDRVCVNNILIDLLAIFKQQSQNQNISLYPKQQLSDKQSEIYTDKTKITQILTNLLTNALKFTHEGFIEFGYEIIEKQGLSSLQFFVKDTGIGIKPEFHEKIFERFRQADKSINKLYGGTGLGLAISKAFAELLGGKIWVESEFEKGATFYFTIPYNPVNEIDISVSPIIQNENFRTVLVAEDEEFNFILIEELLADLDLKLIHAKDGQETVEIVKSNPQIDMILMDIKMPIMTGHEAAIIIKQLRPNLPIVAQSAYALEHERAKYEKIFDDYLTKPIDEEALKQMVMKYVAK